MDLLYKLSACDVVEKLKSAEISIHDALDSIQSRIEQVDGTVNALPTLSFERARQDADRLQNLPVEQRGPLSGLPVTIKDLTAVEGVRTTSGSRVFEHDIPHASDQLVSRIESAGGVVYAKSNTPEFGTGGITFNDVFGITVSPHNTRYASGGSSGGAAASLASGCAWLSQGSDMAGSLRTPAGFCGVTSLRPSPGRIKFDSEYLPYDVLAAEGPMARTIQDLALFADVMFENSGQSMQGAAERPLAPARVAFSSDLGITSVSDEVADNFQAFVKSLSTLPTKIVEASPDFTGVHVCFDRLRAHAYAIGLEAVLSDHREVLKPEVVWNIEAGLALTSSQLREATRMQGQIINRSAVFMRDFDLLICPATSVTAVEKTLRYPGSNSDVPVPDYYRWLAIAYAITVSALPVLTVPVAFSSSGLPFAVQLIGKPGGEANLFRYAREIEQLFGWSAEPIDPK